ncbi:hypothetical protein LTR17_004671 [Elasticomyces elasticus]|nr:hypothetical protein LTR17_004671 [Elasticomyces elasticus]
MATLPDDDEYEVPLRDQRFFGAGVKRKRIQFVPSSNEATSTQSLPPVARESAAKRYLDIVLKQSDKPTQNEADESESKRPTQTRCDICHLPITSTDTTSTPHESSIAHQICLEHSHPPSHLDRSRVGLTIMQGQDWDPDSRRGLGAGGEGRLHPVKAVENPKKAGLGARFEKIKVVEKPVKLDPGKMKLQELAGKKKAERLRNAFYRSEEVEKYLGQEDGGSRLDMKAFGRSRTGR